MSGNDFQLELQQLTERLFPIFRSLTGDGVRETIRILQQVIDVKRWHVPKSHLSGHGWDRIMEWEMKAGTVTRVSDGKVVIDFARNNLHILHYSDPVDEILSFHELKDHLHTLPNQPDVIPYKTAYYAPPPSWGFCLSYNDYQELEKLGGGELYQVHISSRKFEGGLDGGCMFIPGSSDKYILLSTYVCHPSLAQDNLSGVIVMTYLARYLSTMRERYYNYLIYFIPETIGAIQVSHHLHRTIGKHANLVGGYVITCCGKPGPYSYIQTRLENTLTDRITEYVLETRDCMGIPSNLTAEPCNITSRETTDYGVVRCHCDCKRADCGYILYDFTHCGSDERQYCYPTINYPIGSLMTVKHGEYKEYHTSADDLSNISYTYIQRSIELYTRCLNLFEINHRYTATTLGEPKMSSYNLYPTIGTAGAQSGRERASTRLMMNVLRYCDGDHDLLQLSEKLHVGVDEVEKIVKTLFTHKLIDRLEN